ncbi:MAG: cysteine desulfurase [Clostridia bacterium]|nr:cysteine desulfurase [Clostridia bacterium]
MFVYLDNSATTKPYSSVVEIIKRTMAEDFGNPSSLHSLGFRAERILKEAREVVAQSIGALSEEVFFTSGGTESDNTAIFGAWEARKKQGKRILTTQIEHPAILRACEHLQKQGAEVVYLPVNADGILDMNAFKAALNEGTILISVMHVNNETGAVMPIWEIRDEIKKTGINTFLHTDAVQSYTKLDTKVNEMGVDFMSLSGHKIGGPKGIGALYKRRESHISPFIYGGGQENGFRSGTENLPGIAGFAEAIRRQEENKSSNRESMRIVKTYLRDLLEERIEDIQINTPQSSAPSVLNVSFLGCKAEVLLHVLEQHEIYVSTGSACSSKKKGSHVLEAMGLSSEAIEGAVRFSFSQENTKEQMEYVVEKMEEAVKSQRRLRHMIKKDKS